MKEQEQQLSAGLKKNEEQLPRRFAHERTASISAGLKKN
jgi:hypothetical protein